MKILALVAALLMSLDVLAAPVKFVNCQSAIETEEFIPCQGPGENAGQPCDSVKTLHGYVSADMTIDSQSKTAQASLRFTDLKGNVSSLETTCSVDRWKWMNCQTTDRVPVLGRFTISFNINGIAPDVYFAQIFADIQNAPVGGFQNTDDVCQR